MGIIAWIVLGVLAGALANSLLGTKHGIAVTIATGIAGALLGGWVGSRLFHVDTTNGFFDTSTWITAVIGSVALLLIYHGLTSGAPRPLRRRSRR